MHFFPYFLKMSLVYGLFCVESILAILKYILCIYLNVIKTPCMHIKWSAQNLHDDDKQIGTTFGFPPPISSISIEYSKFAGLLPVPFGPATSLDLLNCFFKYLMRFSACVAVQPTIFAAWAQRIAFFESE